MKKIIAAGLIAASLNVVLPVSAHKANHREVIKTQGTAFCTEDARLVPVRHHGYHPERVGGWIYKCKNFDSKGKFAR